MNVLERWLVGCTICHGLCLFRKSAYRHQGLNSPSGLSRSENGLIWVPAVGCPRIGTRASTLLQDASQGGRGAKISRRSYRVSATHSMASTLHKGTPQWGGPGRQSAVDNRNWRTESNHFRSVRQHFFDIFSESFLFVANESVTLGGRDQFLALRAADSALMRAVSQYILQRFPFSYHAAERIFEANLGGVLGMGSQAWGALDGEDGSSMYQLRDARWHACAWVGGAVCIPGRTGCIGAWACGGSSGGGSVPFVFFACACASNQSRIHRLRAV